jgi:hypothetical protein
LWLARPFYHLELEQEFPEDIDARMLSAMPVASDYRPLTRLNRCNVLPNGTHTRVNIDLFPEYIRHFPPEKHALLDIVGRALCGEAVKEAFVRQLAPALARATTGQKLNGVQPRSGSPLSSAIGLACSFFDRRFHQTPDHFLTAPLSPRR